MVGELSGGSAALHRRLFIMSPLARLKNGITQLNDNMKKNSTEILQNE
jgi:hypothetical protein